MRDELARREGMRTLYRATVARFGSKPSDVGPAVPTILLRDVTDCRGAVVTDHVWYTLGEPFTRLCLEEGDVVEFEARVIPYQKGYHGRDDHDSVRLWDYRLSYPARVRKAKEQANHQDTKDTEER